MTGKKDLVDKVQSWFELHVLDDDVQNSLIVETYSLNEAKIAKDYLVKNPFSSRYSYIVNISARLQEDGERPLYEMKVELDADY